MDLVDRILTSSSFGANGVMCLFNSSSVSNAVKCRVLNFTVSKPAVAVGGEKEKLIVNVSNQTPPGWW